MLISTHRYVLTADDFGMLKLFHAPCVVEDAPFQALRDERMDA